MLGFQECCDAVTYFDLGQICLQRGYDICSLEYRPLGSLVLNALLYPYGLAPLSHALLLAFSLFMTCAVQGQGNAEKVWGLKNCLIARHDKQGMIHLQKYLLKALGAFLLLEFMFMGLASVNLTDVPAGVFAAFAIVGFYRKNAVLFALAAGVSVLIRAAYLYPMLAMVAYFIAESLYKKSWSKAAISSLFFLCQVPQYWQTYQHLGIFSFLDPAKVEYWRNFHFSSNLAGYDTLINPIAAHPWQSGVPLGLAAAFEQRHWGELLRLLVSRVDFYFASFVPLGKVYLTDAGERIFSPIIFFLHLAALVVSYLYIRSNGGGGAWRIWIPLSIILAQSLLIIPEQRFIVVIQLFLAVFAWLYFLGMVQSKRQAVKSESTK